MAPRDIKKIGTHRQEVEHQHGSAWEVMKPFVTFGVMATGLIAGALVTIIKNIPKPDGHKPSGRKDNKIIKI